VKNGGGVNQLGIFWGMEMEDPKMGRGGDGQPKKWVSVLSCIIKFERTRGMGRGNFCALRKKLAC